MKPKQSGLGSGLLSKFNLAAGSGVGRVSGPAGLQQKPSIIFEDS